MVDPFGPDDEKLAAIRELLPATSAGIYLDTATAGPFPAETARALAEADDWELRVGRVGPDREEEVRQRAAEAKAVIAALIQGADPDEVLLTHGSADAIVRLVCALRASAAGPAAAGSSILLDARMGAALAPALGPATHITELTPATFRKGQVARGTVAIVPHLHAATGELLPVSRIAQAAHEAGAVVVLDASMSGGQVPVDPGELSVDAVALSGHHWLLGPEGTGALWVSGVLQRSVDLAALEASHGSLPRRALLGLARSVGWLEMYVGLPWAFDRTARLAEGLMDQLAGVDGVELLTPRERRAAIVAFRVAGWDAERVREELGRRVFAICGVVDAQAESAIRLSVGCWNTDEELDRSVAAVRELAAHTPETLPRRPGLVILPWGGEGA